MQHLLDTSHINRKEVSQWLPFQDAYTLHKPARRHYKRNKTIVLGIDDQWQADLVDMSAYAKSNQGYRYILTVIDVFSKYAWAQPLKQKTGAVLVRVLATILRLG